LPPPLKMCLTPLGSLFFALAWARSQNLLAKPGQAGSGPNLKPGEALNS
jgi:hypothetical protein